MQLFLEVLQESGLSGLLVIAPVFLAVSGMLFMVSRCTQDRYLKQCARGGAGAFLALLLASGALGGVVAVPCLAARLQNPYVLVLGLISCAMLFAHSTVMFVANTMRF